VVVVVVAGTVVDVDVVVVALATVVLVVVGAAVVDVVVVELGPLCPHPVEEAMGDRAVSLTSTIASRVRPDWLDLFSEVFSPTASTRT
jgi:hypothetical protein